MPNTQHSIPNSQHTHYTIHAQVTVGDSMLIFGGYAGVMLDDVWEYNVAENCSDTGATCDCTTSVFRCTK